MSEVPTLKHCQDWVNQRNISPFTGKRIKENGPTYKLLQSQAKRYGLIQSTVSPQPTSYKFTSESQIIAPPVVRKRTPSRSAPPKVKSAIRVRTKSGRSIDSTNKKASVRFDLSPQDPGELSTKFIRKVSEWVTKKYGMSQCEKEILYKYILAKCQEESVYS